MRCLPCRHSPYVLFERLFAEFLTTIVFRAPAALGRHKARGRTLTLGVFPHISLSTKTDGLEIERDRLLRLEPHSEFVTELRIVQAPVNSKRRKFRVLLYAGVVAIVIIIFVRQHGRVEFGREVIEQIQRTDAEL